MASRLLLIGHGRMGRVVDALSGEYDFEVVGRIDLPDGTHAEALSADRIPSAEVAIDFSTAAAVRRELSQDRGARSERGHRHDGLDRPRGAVEANR